GAPDELRGVRIDAATGERLAGTGSAAEIRVVGVAAVDEVGLFDGGGFIGNIYGGMGLGHQSAPFGFSVRETAPFLVASADRKVPLVASDGKNYLVLWQLDGADDVRATRIDGVTGKYLDDPPLVVGAGSLMAVASSGADYLVAWVTVDLELQRRFVRA